jgi:hypothetical protein
MGPGGFAGSAAQDTFCTGTTCTTAGAKSIIASYATAMLKGPSGNHFTLEGGNAQSGTFFEGAMTAGNPSDSVDEQIQANIVAAGYGR